MINEFSIQLYSIKEETAKDFTGSLARVGDIGYHGVEFAGYGDVPASEMKRVLDEAGMKSVGTHVNVDRLRDHFREEIEYNKTLGTEYLVIPGFPMKTSQDVDDLIEIIREISPKVREEGFVLGYHNHDFEFQKDEDGQYFLDRLFAAFTPEELVMELDVYWAAFAGIDYLEYMKKHQGQVKLLHLKQIEDFESKRCVDLDEGVIDFAEIAELGNEIGIEHYILEQEEFEESPWISIDKGFQHIMGLK